MFADDVFVANQHAKTISIIDIAKDKTLGKLALPRDEIVAALEVDPTADREIE